jgi:aminomethyltransferase
VVGGVAISDLRSRVLQIQRPASIDILKAASGGTTDKTRKYFRSGYFDQGGQTPCVSQTGPTNELGFEICTDGTKKDHLAL